VSEAWPAIKIKEFEHVLAAPSRSLLRVSGQGPRRRDPGHRPALVIDDGIKQHRFSPLPAPPDSGRSLRAAYAVSSGLVRNARSYWLEHENGKRTNLSVPETGVPRMSGDQAVPPASEPDLPDAYEETRRLEQRIAELEEVHARELRAATRKQADADRQVAEAQAQAETAERRERTANEQAASANTNAESIMTRLGEAEQSVQALRTRLATAERELSQAAAAREPLERELTDVRAVRRNLQREFDHARDQLRLMTSERDELARQAAAFDEIAVRARERAAHAESEHRKSSSALAELETWRAELERRLAATTTELGAMKTAREADERELQRLRDTLAGGNGPAGMGAGHDGPDASATLAAQAAEIERLAAEVASLRVRAANAD
jgi:chromosome segregation ATPase